MRLERTLVSELPANVGRMVRLCGFAHSIEGTGDESAPLAVVLRDHTGCARLVGPGREQGGVGAGDLVRPSRESAIEAVGRVVAAGEGETARLEIEALRVPGPALGEPPLDEHSPLEDRLDWRYLDLRRPRNRLIFEIQTTAVRAMREFWLENGFLEIHSPKIRPIPNKSGRELFTIEYFDRKAYLAQSPQFYKQMAMAAGFDRVFEIGPVFRANPLVTSRHDTEFTSIDVEISWIDTHDDVMALEERWLAHVVGAVANEHGDDIGRHFGVEVVVPAIPFPRVTVAEATKIVEASGYTGGPEGDIDAESERRLSEHVAREHGHEFVFVTEYAASVRPYYHMRTEEGSQLTRGFDLLWKGLEVTTGAQREHRYEVLEAQAKEVGVPTDRVRYYLDFFKYGCPPHGGFGVGLTRLLVSLLGQDDVREVTYLFRGRERVSP